jgi:catechol 2,3-dioxygenase-like lactoylglutathione lyase family enzyme
VKIHLSLNVSDVDRSVAFYEAFFGVSAHKRRPEYANFDLSEPPLKLALEQAVPQPGVGTLNHLGLLVAGRDQVEAARERLIAAGLATFDERDTTCCYALQDKVWVTDPDGNRWEIYALLDDLLEVGEKPAAGCITESQPLVLRKPRSRR